MLHVKLFFFSSCIALSFHTTRKNSLPLFTPLGGDWFYIYIYIFFFQESLLSSFMPLSFQTLENSIRPFIPFWRGWFLGIFQWFLLSFFIELSIHAFGRGGSCTSILLFSSCIALLFHATRKKLFYPYSLLWEGVDFISIYIHIFLSRIFSITPHVSPISNFRKMPLDHSFPFWRDWFLCISQ